MIWGDHWQVQWFLGNNLTFKWFWKDHRKFSMVFEKTITTECFGGCDHCHLWFFNGFWSCYHYNGFDESLWSNVSKTFILVLTIFCHQLGIICQLEGVSANFGHRVWRMCFFYNIHLNVGGCLLVVGTFSFWDPERVRASTSSSRLIANYFQTS